MKQKSVCHMLWSVLPFHQIYLLIICPRSTLWIFQCCLMFVLRGSCNSRWGLFKSHSIEVLNCGCLHPDLKHQRKQGFWLESFFSVYKVPAGPCKCMSVSRLLGENSVIQGIQQCYLCWALVYRWLQNWDLGIIWPYSIITGTWVSPPIWMCKALNFIIIRPITVYSKYKNVC